MHDDAEEGLLEVDEPSVLIAHFTKRCFWGVVLLLCAELTLGISLPYNHPSDSQSWSEQSAVLRKMVLYQKVRLLSSLSDEEVRKKHVDVTSLPAIGPSFWQHEEAQRIARKLGFSNWKGNRLTISGESNKETFVRVSLCITDASVMSLKLMAAVLSLEASIHVCNLPNAKVASSPQAKEFERVWLGNRRLLAEGNRTAESRRLAFNIPASSVRQDSIKEARMSCASQINGMISSLSGVSQYISDSTYTCPPPNEVKTKYPAKCSMGISLLIFGLTKTAAAMSDISVQCKDPTTGLVPYSKHFEQGRERVMLAACLDNVGQAISFLARVGYQLNTIATAPGVCPESPSTYEREVCMLSISCLIADLGQMTTFLAGAASGCGSTYLVPFACASRITASLTGLFGAISGIGAALAWCDHAKWPK
ncbi:unnamed protein product [Durusdinium trenchii]|uniref:Kinesin light chain 2 n=2 Tax=Durusdinium trenchii TaxID=1381693 RepID=A0ABP0QIC4_9DINO